MAKVTATCSCGKGFDNDNEFDQHQKMTGHEGKQSQ